MATKEKNKSFGSKLLKSMEQAALHAEGKKSLNSEVLELPDEPPKYSKNQIKRIREKLLNVSQPVFAKYIGCSPSAVKKWETGENNPPPAARRLLQVLEKNPNIFLSTIFKKS